MKRIMILVFILMFSVSCNSVKQVNVDAGMDNVTIKEPNFADKTSEYERDISELERQIQELNHEIEILTQKYYQNRGYEMFYGEWEATGHVVEDPMPVKGVQYDEEMYKEGLEVLSESIKGKTIQFASENIVINRDKVIHNIKYKYTVFPADDSYLLHFTTTLKDIGIKEADGKYYVFAEVDAEEDPYFYGNEFFIKDENTLIIRDGSRFYEYARISYDGGSENPVIIAG